jgi:radical SAM protein with 4Fe4S-binding SPASM domain
MMEETDEKIARFHLRVDGDGSGMLIANAMASAQLTSSGVIIVKGLLEGQSREEILRTLKANFSGAGDERMRADIDKVEALIRQLTAPGDAYPVFNLEDAAISPYSSQLIAPLQASVPLAAPETLIPVLDRLWEVCIPHVTLLAPPSPDPDHLIRAVEHAEDLGMIAGVRGLAGDLTGDLMTELQIAGVDHITFPYASDDPDLHDSFYGQGDHAAAHQLLNWLEENQISAVAEIPLVPATLETLEESVNTLLEMGADNFSFVAFATILPTTEEDREVFAAEGMAQVATTVEEIAHTAQARFMWNPPVERDSEIPLRAQILAGPRCAGDVAIRVTPEGEVFPPRGPEKSAGNLVHDGWDTIWEDEIFRDYRERVEAPSRCEVCPGLTICAAGCPRDPEAWVRTS